MFVVFWNLLRRAAVGLTLWIGGAILTCEPSWAQDQATVARQISELERAIARFEATPNLQPNQEMEYLLAMARLTSLYAQADRAPDSWPLQEKLLARFEKRFGPDHPGLATQLEANAASYGMQGRYAEAERLRKRAIAINERAHGPDSVSVASSLQGLGNLYRLQERYDEALIFATRALEIAERKLPAGDPQRAIYLSQVADIHMSGRRYALAEPLFKRALAIVESTKGPDTALAGAQTIQYLQSLALAALFQGRHAEGQTYIDRAIALSTRQFGPEHTLTSTMLQTLALQLTDQDRLDEAERLFREALPISEKAGKLRAQLADNYVGLGLIAFKRKSWASAYDWLRKASEISVAIERVAIAGRTATANRVAPRADIFLLHAVAAYRLAETATPDAAALRDDAFQMAQRAERSQVAGALAQVAARVGAGAGPLGTAIRERQDLANEWQRLDKLIEAALTLPQAQRNAGEEQQARQRLTEVAARLEAIDARISREFPGFAKLSDPAPLPIAAVQRMLASNEVMIFIANRLNQSLVWAIGRDTAQWALAPVGEEELVREIAALRCGLDETAWQGDGAKACPGLPGQTWRPGTSLPYDLKRAHALYEALLGPFDGITRGKRLLVATSGPLATLPLHALVTEAPAAAIPKSASEYAGIPWLARRNAIVNLPSVASLQSLRSAPAASGRADRPYLGIANPLLEGPDARYQEIARAARVNQTCAATTAAVGAGSARGQRSAAPRSAILPPQLKGGLAPVALIRTQVPLPETAEEVCAVGSLLGAGEPDIHLAQRATESEVKRLSAEGHLAKYRIVHFATHGALAGQISSTAEPGLLLTPPTAATATDDGYLTAAEITELKLDADWVILSACNTAGAGKAGSEALSGLARAFFYAQARSLLVSHWEVNSDATVKLTTAALNEFARTPTSGRAEALRRAMLALIDASGAPYAHPSFWAPFVIVGEGG